MNLVNYEPGRVLDNLRREVNSAFGQELGNWLGVEGAQNLAAGRWTPAVDIREETDRCVLTADLPGIDPKDVEVTMESGGLTIRGERRQEHKDEGDEYRRVERQYGVFYRHFSLPVEVEPDNISAQSKNGTLEITIPKSEKQKPKRITVKS